LYRSQQIGSLKDGFDFPFECRKPAEFIEVECVDQTAGRFFPIRQDQAFRQGGEGGRCPAVSIAMSAIFPWVMMGTNAPSVGVRSRGAAGRFL
jgi:hypothetical protein